MFLYFLIASYAALFHSFCNGSQVMIEKPRNQTAMLGDSVTLRCAIKDKNGTLAWIFPPQPGRYTMWDDLQEWNFAVSFSYAQERQIRVIGDRSKGEYFLHFASVNFDDEGWYKCQVARTKGNDMCEGDAYLSVQAKFQQPVIQGGPVISAGLGEPPLTLRCSARDGNPAAHISWIDPLTQDSFLHKTGYTVHYQVDNSTVHRVLKTATSTLSFTPTLAHHNKRIMCRASGELLDRPLETEVTLNIRYAPIITLVSDPQLVYLGKVVTLSCSGLANPPEIAYKWYLNDELQANYTQENFIIMGAGNGLRNKIVRCEATNAQGTTRSQRTLQFAEAPKFTQTPVYTIVKLGDKLELRCEASGLPVPKIVWRSKNTQSVLSIGPVLTVRSATYEDQGTYECAATAQGFDNIVARATVEVFGPPVIVMEPSLVGVVGDRVSLTCMISARIAAPSKVQVSHNGNLLPVGPWTSYNLTRRDVEGDRVVMTLSLFPLKADSFGNYTCEAWNEAGSASKHTWLREAVIGGKEHIKDRAGVLLVPTEYLLISSLAACLILILIVSLTALCLLLRRKKPKTPPPSYSVQVQPSHHTNEYEDMEHQQQAGGPTGLHPMGGVIHGCAGTLSRTGIMPGINMASHPSTMNNQLSPGYRKGCDEDLCKDVSLLRNGGHISPRQDVSNYPQVPLSVDTSHKMANSPRVHFTPSPNDNIFFPSNFHGLPRSATLDFPPPELEHSESRSQPEGESGGSSMGGQESPNGVMGTTYFHHYRDRKGYVNAAPLRNIPRIESIQDSSMTPRYNSSQTLNKRPNRALDRTRSNAERTISVDNLQTNRENSGKDESTPNLSTFRPQSKQSREQLLLASAAYNQPAVSQPDSQQQVVEGLQKFFKTSNCPSPSIPTSHVQVVYRPQRPASVNPTSRLSAQYMNHRPPSVSDASSEISDASSQQRRLMGGSRPPRRPLKVSEGNKSKVPQPSFQSDQDMMIPNGITLPSKLVPGREKKLSDESSSSRDADDSDFSESPSYYGSQQSTPIIVQNSGPRIEHKYEDNVILPCAYYPHMTGKTSPSITMAIPTNNKHSISRAPFSESNQPREDARILHV